MKKKIGNLNRSLQHKESIKEVVKSKKRLDFSLSLPRDKHWDTEIKTNIETRANKQEKYQLKSRGNIPKEYLDLIGEVPSLEEDPKLAKETVPFFRQTLPQHVNHRLYTDKSINFTL